MRCSCVRVGGRGWFLSPFTILSRLGLSLPLLSLAPLPSPACGENRQAQKVREGWVEASRLFLLAGNRLGRTLAGPGVGMRALAADRQAAPMPQPAVAAEIHQPLDVHGHFAPQIALNHVVAVDDLADLQDFLVCKLGYPALLGNPGLLHDLTGLTGADAMDILKRNHYPLVGWYVDAGNSGHGLLLFAAHSLSPPLAED